MEEKSKFSKALEDEKIPYLVGETAYIHEGDFSYIDNFVKEIIRSNCCDAIKFHIMIDVDSYITKSHDLYNLYQRMKMPKENWIKILEKVKSTSFETVVLADDKKAIDFVKENIDLFDALELHAIALNNIEMLKKAKDIKIPLVLGIGGSQIDDIQFALDFLDRKDILLMHGFQNYPTKYEYINYRRIQRLKDKFGLSVGYADHTIWDSKDNELLTLAGFMAGANFLEKHLHLNPGEKRIDFDSAISIDQMKYIKEKVGLLNRAKGDGSFKISEYENIYAQNGPMKFTVVAAEYLKKGDIITENDITFRRTGEENNIKQREYLNIIGKRVLKNINKYQLVNWDVVEK